MAAISFPDEEEDPPAPFPPSFLPPLLEDEEEEMEEEASIWASISAGGRTSNLQGGEAPCHKDARD
jgi:hypothetical protein